MVHSICYACSWHYTSIAYWTQADDVFNREGGLVDGFWCFGTWRRERDGKVSYSCCESLLFPHSLRQRRRWHSGGMLTDTDSGLKPQWCIFLTLLLTHRRLEGLIWAPSCGMQTFLNPGERLEAYSTVWRRETWWDGPELTKNLTPSLYHSTTTIFFFY